MFGPHLLLEAYGSPVEKLSNLRLIGDLLDNFPSKLQMHKIMPPYVFKYDGDGVKEDRGVSGIVLIAESHIALHTFPEKQFFTLDIFSCKDFNIRMAVDIALEVLEPVQFDETVLTRGREFPKSIGRAIKVVTQERRRIASVK